MTDIVLNDITSGYNTSRINANFTKIEDSINNDTIRRSGGGNTMNQDLDMNSYRILNARLGGLSAPVALDDAVRLTDLNSEASIRATADDTLNTKINTLQANQQSGLIGYSTLAALNADLNKPAGTVAIVTNDPTVANNTTYSKLGASGTGSWQVSVDRITNLQTNYAASAGSSSVGFIQAGTGAIARTVQDKSRDTINAKDFGVVANGVTDDTIALNKALAYLQSLSGGTLTLPSGTILISSNVGIPANVRMIGQGIDSTIVKLSNNSASGGFLLSSNSSVQALTYNGNKANQTVQSYAMLGYRVDGASITNVKVINNYGISVGWSDSARCSCQNVNVSGSGANQPGFFAATSSNVSFYGDGAHQWINCKSTGNDLDGMILNTPNCHIDGGSFSGNGLAPTGGALGGAGIYSDTVLDSITISNVYCNANTEYGINIISSNSTLTGNTCNGNQLSGILLRAGTYGTSVQGNTCKYNGYYAGSANPTIWLKAGIELIGPIGNTTFTGNICYDDRGGSATQNYGILYASSAAGSTLTNISMNGNQCNFNKIDADNLNPNGYTYGTVSGLVYNDKPSVQLVRGVTGTIATPSVVGANLVELSGSITVTNFVGGVDKQRVLLTCISGQPTITHGAAIKLAGAVNFTFNGSFMSNLELINKSGVWYEINRTQL